MSLVAAALASKVISSIYNLSNPTQVCQKIGQSIAEYLCDNTTVMYSWTGIQPSTPPLPDPVVVCYSTKLMGTFVCYPTKAVSAVQHGIQLGAQIQQGILQLKAVPPAGWAIPPATFMCVTPLILTPTQANNSFAHWVQWSQTIISTFMTYINPTPLPGTHGSFVGTPGAIMTSIF